MCSLMVVCGGDETLESFKTRMEDVSDLTPEGWIELRMHGWGSIDMLEFVLSGPHAKRVRALRWVYIGSGDMCPVTDLIVANCPNLKRLALGFMHTSDLYMVRRALEGGIGLTEVEVHLVRQGRDWDVPGFFREVLRSKVEKLTVAISKDADDAFNKRLKPFLEQWSGWLVARYSTEHRAEQLAQLKAMVWTPSCRLSKLVVEWDGWVTQGGVVDRTPYPMNETFKWTQRMFVLLQGQQLKRNRKVGNPLRRLPVEMIRLVAAM